MGRIDGFMFFARKIRLRFALAAPIPFPTIITVTLNAVSSNVYASRYLRIFSQKTSDPQTKNIKLS